MYVYDDIGGDPHALKVSRINPYLVEAENIVVRNRNKPISPVPEMRYGSKPSDGGFFIMSEEERQELIKLEPGAVKLQPAQPGDTCSIGCAGS